MQQHDLPSELPRQRQSIFEGLLKTFGEINRHENALEPQTWLGKNSHAGHGCAVWSNGLSQRVHN